MSTEEPIEPEETPEAEIANYHCPICESLSELILSPTQAFCTNTSTGCPLVSFNPSLPDRGMSVLNFIDTRFGEKK